MNGGSMMPGWIEIERMVRRGHYTMALNHFHDHYEMYYLLSGERYYFIQNKTYHVQKGDLVLIGKQTLHKTADTGLADHERVLVSFNSDYLQSPSLEQSLTTVFVGDLHLLRLNVQQQTYIESLLFELDREQQEQREHHDIYVHALLQQLLITVHRIYARAQDVFEFVSPTHQKISEMADYINQHYAERLPLTEVAAAFHMSAYYTSRMFKQVTGFSYIEYINSVRVKEAQRRLRETKRKVIRIAEEVGFESVAHFGRVFKQISGLAPMEYRRVNRMSP
ncbi:MAG: AraC family transcriptional regulator [Paenibacillaceae bacterium]